MWPFRKKEKPLDIRFVADIPLNQDNHFWHRYIGMPISVLRQDPDGLMTVQLHDQPVAAQGIDPKRFT